MCVTYLKQLIAAEFHPDEAFVIDAGDFLAARDRIGNAAYGLDGEYLSRACDRRAGRIDDDRVEENPAYSVSPGNDTVDKIFILSIPEANTYFDSDSARQCLGTEYCYAQGVSKDDDGYCWWLLRTPGYESRLAAFITSYGSVSNRGDGVNHERSAIRPVMWINLLP